MLEFGAQFNVGNQVQIREQGCDLLMRRLEAIDGGLLLVQYVVLVHVAIACLVFLACFMS
jgi:hypothetical protein